MLKAMSERNPCSPGTQNQMLWQSVFVAMVISRDLLYRLQLLFLNRALIFDGIFSALQGVVRHQEDRKKSLQP